MIALDYCENYIKMAETLKAGDYIDLPDGAEIRLPALAKPDRVKFNQVLI